MKKFFTNIAGVLLFKSSSFIEVRRSLASAVVIVLLVACSHAVAGYFRAKNNGWDPIESVIFALQGEILFWLVLSFVCFLSGVIFRSNVIKFIDLLASLGYAIVPGILIILTSISRSIEIPLLVFILLYRILTSTIAVHQLMNLKKIKALIIVLIGHFLGYLCLGLGIRFTELLIK